MQRGKGAVPTALLEFVVITAIYHKALAQRLNQGYGCHTLFWASERIKVVPVDPFI